MHFQVKYLSTIEGVVDNEAMFRAVCVQSDQLDDENAAIYRWDFLVAPNGEAQCQINGTSALDLPRGFRDATGC